jgi:hypothetical protein
VSRAATPEGEHTYAEAAKLLGGGIDWLKQHTPKVPLPHYKKSLSRNGRGSVTFSDAHIAEIKAMFEVRPAKPKRVRSLARGRAS